MNYEQMKEEATSSDHGIRIISELEEPIKEALANTPSDAPILEIGNREGGSAAVLLYYLELEGKGRRFVTVDVSPCPARITRLAEAAGIPHEHHQMAQDDFVRGDATEWGFIFLDADHSQDTVSRDMARLRLVRGGIMAVDDVNAWEKLPEIEGLVRTEFLGVDEGGQRGTHGHHIVYYGRV